MTDMITRLIKAFFLLLVTQMVIGQGISFENLDWDATLNKAASADKPIFIDVYTTWCAPCIRMDKTTFQDSAVGAQFNDKFISIKVNAEDNGNGSMIANRFNVGSYPTLIFLSSSGEVISTIVGMQNNYDLLSKSESALTLYENFDRLKAVKANVYGNYSKEELIDVLSTSKGHPFEGKERLSSNYLDMLVEITEEDLQMVMGEVKQFDLSHLKRVALLTTSLSYDEMRVRRNAKEWITWRNDTEFSINQFLKNATENKDFITFEKAIEVLRDTRVTQPKQIDRLYYNYYRRNDLDQYKTFASYMITEYIIPSRPEDVAAADREKYKLLNDEIRSGMARLANTGVIIEEEVGDIQTATIDSIAEIYTISKSIADDLFDISSDFSAFFDDEGSKRKADFWASLTYKYYPYDLKYYDNHIYILKSMGKHIAAQELEREMKALPYYNEMKIKAASAW